MPEQHTIRILIQRSNTTSYYSEQQASEHSRLETHLIRQLREAGVLGAELTGEEPRYSYEDLIILRRVRRLHQDLGVNMEGVEVILRLYAQLDALQRELEGYQARAQQTEHPGNTEGL